MTFTEPSAPSAADAARGAPPSPDDLLRDYLARGDERAYLHLAKHYGPRIKTYLRRILREDSWADELTVDVLAAVFQSGGECRAAASLSVWIFRVARNRALDLLRHNTTHGKAETEAARQANEVDRFTPLRLLEKKELSERLEDAIAEIAEPFRSAFLLREKEGLSYEEIAEVLETSAKTVSSRIFRARLFLRSKLTKYLDGTDDVNETEDDVNGGSDHDTD